MKNVSLLVMVAAISFIAGAGLTYVAKTPWTSDMANQPSIKPQEWPLLPPQGSVTTDLLGGTGPSSGKTSESVAGSQEMGDQQGGGASAGHQHDGPAAKHDHGSQKARETPAKAAQHDHSSHPHADGGGHDHGAVGSSAGKGRIEKMKAGGAAAMQQHSHGAGAGDGHAHGAGAMPAQVVNPIKASETSVKKGHQLFTIYCSVCHGTEGRGGMPMESKLPGIPKFTAKLLRSVDDNHMFSMVTSGHGPMPAYAEALTPEERWHVTNYVRTLPETLAAQNKEPIAQRGSR